MSTDVDEPQRCAFGPVIHVRTGCAVLLRGGASHVLSPHLGDMRGWVMTSETLAGTRARGRLMVLEARGPRSEACRGVGVHGADIKGVAALHAREKPQDFNDARWAH